MHNISHAYIFSGTDERTTDEAQKLAQMANCENKELAPCGFCNICVKIQNNVHPDVVHIFPQGTSIKIQQVRNLIVNLTKKPVEGAKKIYIIHDAHTMTPEAQNALLKTLEDPIAQTVVILLCSNLKQIIPTVISRCQIRDFSKLSAKSQLPLESRQKIAEIFICTSLKQDFTALGPNVKGLSDMTKKTGDILEFLLSLYRDALLVKTNSNADLINEDFQDAIDKFASKLTLDKILKAFEFVHEQLKAEKSRGNKNLILYNLLLDLEEVI